MRVLDATCPLVLEIHKIARNLQQDSYRIVVIGDHGHDEVVGIAGQVQTDLIVSTPEDAEQLERISRMGVVVQSTQNIDDVQTSVVTTTVFFPEKKLIDKFPCSFSHECVSNRQFKIAFFAPSDHVILNNCHPGFKLFYTRISYGRQLLGN